MKRSKNALNGNNMASHSKKNVPLALSLVSAGSGMQVEDDYELIDINYLVTGGRDDFLAFEVTGDSMSPTIRTGDIVFIDTMAEVRPGDVIVAVIDGLNCIKIFEKAPDHLYLVSGNSSYPTREVTNDSFYVVGKVKGYLSIM